MFIHVSMQSCALCRVRLCVSVCGICAVWVCLGVSIFVVYVTTRVGMRMCAMCVSEEIVHRLGMQFVDYWSFMS